MVPLSEGPDLGELPADFDVRLYIFLNPDLEIFDADPQEAVLHYLREGRQEGRLYTFDTNKYGQLPADFDADLYLDLNPDLEALRGKNLDATAHYLAQGRSEGRSYKAVARSPEDIARRRAKTRHSSRHWTKHFNASDFRALRPDLARDVVTREQAIAAFLDQGVEQLVPLAVGVAFDPAFYQTRFEDVARLTPPEAYRHWLFEGLPAERPGSELEAVAQLLGMPEFPDAFDWERYVAPFRSIEPEPQWTRLQALEHLLQTGLDESAEVPIKEPQGVRFLEAISDVLWKRRRRKAAFEVLQRALELEPSNGKLHRKTANRHLEIMGWGAAETHWRRALDLGETAVWTYAHLIDLALRRDDVEDAYLRLDESKAAHSGLRPWRDALWNTIERDFAVSAERAWALYHGGKRHDADHLIEAVLVRISDALRRLDDLPGFVGPTENGHVVMFANHSLPQCRHYRVEQRCRQLDVLGVPYRLFDSQDAEAAREALVGARALLVYREPAFPATIKLMLHARALGVPIFFDIDDLIFDPVHYPDSFEVYDKQISFDAYVGLLYGVPLIRFAITLSDAGIASTTALARHIEPLTTGRVCHIVPNGLDDRNDRFLHASAALIRGSDDEIFIFYGSGTKAHNRNFNETVGPALVELLASRAKIKLVIVGYLDLDPAFEPFTDKILRFGFSSDLAAYWALLSEVDINLAVLVPGEMNDCKSEIKWLEAAVSAVPSIVSASARYREVLNPGVDAMLAGSHEEWREALFRLVDDAPLRRRVGSAARARATAAYSLELTARMLDEALQSRCSAPRRPAGQPIRILLVHVLFPPQTSGGATRVVRDNVDDLLDRYGQEFELAVFSTDFDAPHPSSRVGHYRSIPVFRCSRNASTEFDYEDQYSAEHFRECLRGWKPDLVHFHCIQFLTGSIVEVCRAAGIPYVVTLHDAWWISPYQFLIDDDMLLRSPNARAICEPSSDLDSMAEIDRKRFLADQLEGAAAIMAVSERFAQVYREAGFPGTRSVPNGLSPAFANSFGHRNARHDGRVRIGHIGGTSQHKGVHLLRIALESRAFRNLEAVVIEHNEDSAFARSALWGSTPVTMRGAVPQEKVADLYGGLDVLVAPSIWPESYGLVSREALAMGLWVVVGDLGAIGEDVVEGENGFTIDVRDARALTAVLERIDADPDTYRASPPRIFHPRMATEQTDDLVALYREIAMAERAALARTP